MVEHKLSELTETWGLFMGLIFIAFVMFAPNGILGMLKKNTSAGKPSQGHAS
jgi:ABC-type branched-subunit amino acid transport system permease subunit